MPTVIPVRMHYNPQDLWFDPSDSGATKGDHVIVSTERGTEFGLATMDPFDAPEEEIKGELKPVLRIATDEDFERADELAGLESEAMPVFRRLVKESGLDIKPVGVEFLFGGEKAVFYFAAEDRVDFRDLVKELASEFHQRVDMRQIGVRDEARIAGGYAPCGQELCCVRFGGQFQPVSIRMAKEQDLPLNSSKISGVCGRLMCCLRYEFEAYRDFKQRAPKKNTLIDTPLGKAKIVEYNTPKETLLLRLENGKSFTVALKDMTCSEGCCKKAKEQGIPLRPDTITREALEALGTAEIMMQLAELDRNSGEGYVLDMSLLEAEKPSRRRKHEAPQNPPTEKTPRKRSGTKNATPKNDQAEKQQVSGKANEAEETPQPEPKRQPRGGGMRPRKTPKTQDGAKAQHGPQQRKAANEEQKPSANPQRRSKAADKQQGDQAETPQRRTRRHHSVEAADGERKQTRQRDQKPASRKASPENQPKTDRPPRANSSAQKATKSEEPAKHQTRRRRKPGDKGGASAESTAE